MMSKSQLSVLFTLLFFSLLLGGCEDTEDESSTPRSTTMTLNFEAMVGAESFNCGRDFEGLGSSSTTLIPTDFKLFIHDIELLKADGETIAFELEDDGVWQLDGIAMLDFENAQGSCSNGTVETHTGLTGSAPEGDYTGIRFKIGVPFSHNHADPAAALAPLSYTSMHWNWQGGYKFIRFDASNGTDEGFRVHLGSTGCEGTVGDISSCSRPNRPEVSLKGFNPVDAPITLDIAALLQGADISSNSPNTGPGCMSAPDDSDCDIIFDNLGLDRNTGENVGVQQFLMLR